MAVYLSEWHTTILENPLRVSRALEAGRNVVSVDPESGRFDAERAKTPLVWAVTTLENGGTPPRRMLLKAPEVLRSLG